MSSPVPAVSVLMTAYNREDYIASAIESVLAQRYRDLELIIVDDGSTDGTLRVAERYAATDDRVRVIGNERNLGDYPNRNRAARLARGELLKFHDSDDLMYSHCLEVMVPLLLARPQAGLAMTGRCAWAGGPVPMELSPRLSYAREFLGSGAFQGGPACALFRRSAFEAMGGFPDVGAHADYVMWLAFCARYPVVLVPGDLFWYRTHPDQQLHSEHAQRDYARVHMHAWQALHVRSCPLDGKDLQQARRNAIERLVRHTLRDLRHGKFSLAAYRWRQAGVSLRDFIRYAGPSRRTVHAGTPMNSGHPA